MERRCTFASLSRDFEMPAKEVRRLASECGIPVSPRGRFLTDTERDRLYDAWLALSANVDDSVNGKMFLIDTSSLLHPGAEMFLKNSSPATQANTTNF